ncbi:hypothetical protein Ahy_A03g015644 [Arachis hypogaea]|uniref:Uncharacterized protein n=1 Tax=Arachis hypogaea TaxID=3818 RepID=A0A445E137_ARAHY|nr:hypothetical protein Ahy_A03g015644 [Arachis hypogaea]
MWPGDTNYEKFEVYSWPTNIVVDLKKKFYTRSFWQLSGNMLLYLYFYLIIVIHEAGKRLDEFCHKWLTTEAYNDTYAFNINPIPGQTL